MKYFIRLISLLFALSGCAQQVVNRNLAPEYSLETIEGRIIKLADARGKYLLLSFSAPWCFICQAEMERLLYLQRYFGDQQLQVMVVATLDTPEHLRTYANSHRGLPILLDYQSKLANSYNVASLPTSFLIGPDGEFAALRSDGEYRFEGIFDWGAAENIRELAQLLENGD